MGIYVFTIYDIFCEMIVVTNLKVSLLTFNVII